MPPIDPALEREYNNRALVPEHAAIFSRWRANSAAFRANTDAVTDLSYGNDDRHRLDLFRCVEPRGTVVFIHGGYWRSLDKSDFSFVAAPLLAQGLSVVAINYRLCPAVPIGDIIEDCRQALVWLVTQGAARGLRVDRVALAGHSAGGHLVAALFATDWAGYGIDPAIFVGGAAVSGLFDLAPLLHCSMNTELLLDEATAWQWSPCQLQPRLLRPLHLTVGGNESAAFRQQTARLGRAWPGICREPEVLANCNHFTVVDDFFAADGVGVHCLRGLFR